MSMGESYVINISPTYKHAMKRAVAPGGKIPLDELYEQYGKKYDLGEGEEFARWLRDVKLPDIHSWTVVLCAPPVEEPQEEVAETTENEAPKEVSKEASDGVEIQATPKPKSKGIPRGERHNVPFVPQKAEVKDIVHLPVRKAHEMLPKITDYKLLKYAYEEARQLANKDTLCNLLRKRIQELELHR